MVPNQKENYLIRSYSSQFEMSPESISLIAFTKQFSVSYRIQQNLIVFNKFPSVHEPTETTKQKVAKYLNNNFISA